VVIVGLSVFGFGALRANYDSTKSDSVKGVERQARLAGALGSSLVGLVQQELVVLSKAPAFQDVDVAGMDRSIVSANPIAMGFNGGIAWLDSTATVGTRFDVPDTTPTIDLSLLDAVRDALQGDNAITSLDGIDGSSVRPLVFAVPTRDPQGAVNGALVGTVVLESDNGELLQSLFGTDAVIALDADGTAVFGGSTANRDSIELARQAAARIGDRNDGVLDDLGGSVVGFSHVPTADWLIVIERSQDDLFGPARGQFERSLVALGLLFLVSVFGVALGAFRLDRLHQREADGRLLFQTVLEQLPVGVVAVDRNGRVVVTNGRAARALGSRTAVGDPAPASLGALDEAMAAGAVVRGPDVIVNVDGNDRSLVVRAAPVESNGHVTGAAAIVDDVTVQRTQEQRAAALAKATAALGSATSREEVAAIVAADGAAAFGAVGGMVMLRDEVAPERLVLMSAAGFGEGVAEAWPVISVDAAVPVAEAVRTAGPVYVTIDDGPARFPDMGDLLTTGGNQAWAALPLRSAGRVDGVLGLSFSGRDDIDSAVQSRLVGFAALVSQALDRSSRQSMEHDVALVLQRGLLQPASTQPVGIEVVSRYRPAQDHLQVGGDFFDVLALDDGSVMLVIGDVVGHGIDAASAMGQLRSAVRANSATTSSPARILELLDRFVAIVPAGRFATAAVVVIDPERSSLRYSVAGHPPPVWITADGEGGLLDQALSRPLGVYPDERPEATFALDASTMTVCLYTDGLIEKRGEVIDAGIELAVATARRHAHLSCEELADRMLTDVGGAGHQRDDIAILCARF